MDILIGAIISNLYIPTEWRADVRQQILLAWFEGEYDPARQHKEILVYAYRRAFMTISEWRRRVLLPVTTHRSGPDPEPQSTSFELLIEDKIKGESQLSSEANLHTLPPDEVYSLTYEEDPDEGDVDRNTAHCINIPKTRLYRGSISYEHLITLLSEGLTVEEVSAVTGLTERSIYRRLASLKDENHYAV